MDKEKRPAAGGDSFKHSVNNLGLLVLRLSSGGLMVLLHGWPKFEKLMNGGKFADPIGLGSQASLILATGAELGCAALVVLGLLTRLACIPLLFTLFIAVFVVHGTDPLIKKELALLYAGPFLTLLLIGPGRWSLDQQGK